MHISSLPRAARLGLAACALILCAAPSLHAQAWLPRQGRGSVSLTYIHTEATRHLFSAEIDGVPIGDGQIGRSDRIDLGQVRSNTGIVSFDYGVLDRLAVSGDVAFVAADYFGSAPESDLDVSNEPREFQDVSLAFRFAALKAPVVATPFVGVSVPTHHYETLGHTAVGSRLSALQLGLNLGRTLAPYVSQAYVHASYSFSLVEKVGPFRANRSVIGVEGGYFLTRALSVRAVGGFGWTHGGIDWLDAEAFEHHGHDHDRVAKAEYTRVGGGLGYSVYRWLDLYAVYDAVVAGSNTHNAQSVTLGTGWNF